MQSYYLTSEEVLKAQEVSDKGLTHEQITERQSRFGKNKLAEGKKTPLFIRFLKELADPMTLILLAAAAVSGITAAYSGESFADVIIILAVVLINAVLGVVQESKAEKAIEALQEMSAATTKVIRNGAQAVVKSEELVPGDIILLEAGDAVPADGRLLEAASLKIEEAALTGESLPVIKQTNALPAGKEIPLGDRSNMVYMGSSVAYGRGKAVILATGMQTEMGKIAGALSASKEDATPLQKKLNQLSKLLSFLVLGICAIIMAVGVIRSLPGITFKEMLNWFMVAVSLAVAAIPEGLAAVVTIVLSMGVTNMSRKNAIIRKMTAVETLGCTQVICSDKTGTLTQNRMTVIEASPASDMAECAASFALCTDAAPDETGRAVGEPTQCAVVDWAASLGMPKGDLNARFPRIGEIPFDSDRKMMTTLHKLPEGGIIQHTSGAPDVILSRCAFVKQGNEIVPMNDELRQRYVSENKRLADQALRVISAAYTTHDWLPKDISSEALEHDLVFLGLVGLMDPIRAEVKIAIGECKKAGIRPVMITGDHKDTAAAIGKQLGILESTDEAITGAQLDTVSDEQLDKDIEKYSVYARVQPEHKVRIVNAWRKKGKITAMTGDGVNDAPSIKNADIGIGMGVTGTDVTKNVADMVLADDNFATIVTAVEEGRRIYDNIRKSIQFLLAANLAEVLAILAATLMGFTILEPVHLLWINLITDCLPALALGIEKAEGDLMSRPPRDPKEGIFAGGMLWDILLQGIAVTLITLASYFVGHFMESGVWEITNSADGMTMAFLTLSMVEIVHSFNMRSRRASVFSIRRPNKLLWASMGISLVLTAAVIFIPPVSALFGFETISDLEYVAALGFALLILPIVEAVKWLQRRLNR